MHILLNRIQTKRYSFRDMLAGRKDTYSLELVGTHAEGIRFIIAVPKDEVSHVQRNLLSYLPGIKIRRTKDYLTGIKTENIVGATELELAGDISLPFKDHKALAEHDPIAFLAGHMTNLRKGEAVAVQLVVTPLRKSTHLRELRHIRHTIRVIARGDNLSPHLTKKVHGIPRSVWLCLYIPVWVNVFALKIILAMIVAFSDSQRSDIAFFESRRNKRRADNPYEQELAQEVKKKLEQPLFEVSLRILAAAKDPDEIDKRIKTLIATYQMFTSSYQSWIPKRVMPFQGKRQFKKTIKRYTHRALPETNWSHGSIVSSSELSDLYHFPNADTVMTEGLLKSRSRELPAPLSQKHRNSDLDVTIGTSSYGGTRSPIGLTLAQRQKHTYIIGKTGMGKTTMLTNAIYQDMVNGKGLAVLDPHGDMFRELLAIVPEHRRNDVVVFDPSDREHPVGLNMLAPGIPFASKEDYHSWIASAVIATFAKLTNESYWGPRMEHILRSTVLSALQLPDPTFYTVQRLLTDKRYQRTVAAQIKDPVLKQFWQKEMLSQGNMQIASTVAPLTHRLGHFITDPLSRHILLQPQSTLRLSDIMDEGKILLVNLSKGDIGEDQSYFFGTMLTSLIWIAAYQRTKQPENTRRDFFVYIDEFQNFAAPRFAEIASEGRKFHIALTLSHQNIAQIEDKKALKVMVGNAHTIISLKAGPEDESFILPFMHPVVEKGDIVNLAPYHFFMKTTAGESEDAFSGQTVLLNVSPSETTAAEVVAKSRKHYAIPRKQAERYVAQLMDGKKVDPTPASKPRAKRQKSADVAL